MSKYIEHIIEGYGEEYIGSVEGVLLESNEELYNALDIQKILFEDDLRQILSEHLPIAFLKNMYVEDDFRNQGYGNQLVDMFINESSDLGANAIILESDEGEDNDFVLTKWYESFGFEKLESKDINPIMILIL
jgi:GNAT superfamily N-acetyltransferase